MLCVWDMVYGDYYQHCYPQQYLSIQDRNKPYTQFLVFENLIEVDRIHIEISYVYPHL
jgi:hypothetical protein